uniref:DPP IV N-terminal domain-containing protein n=1 Tax=Roseihalotalea indica TaxID=2867963 RepID=A0AA49GNF7_9BACT|nr:DPP IV N-terminal domain-containing protein [Tunicatimonas sp. TK19036]
MHLQTDYTFKLRPQLPLFLFLFLVGHLTYGQSGKTYTEADYDQAAAMLTGNVAKLIDNDIETYWLPDGRLWYESLTEDQATFVLFNPADGTKITADSREDLFEKGAVVQEEPIFFNEVLSPDGKYSAFIRDWNLWMREVATGEETVLTTDGVEDFGYATDNAGWRHSDAPILSWSPDSKKIATFQQDQRHVKDMYLVRTQVGSPELQAWKYPLPGDSAIIQIHRVIIDIDGEPEVVRLKMGPDARRGTLCDDISCDGEFDDVAWSDDSQQLVFVSTSRDHKQAKVRMADTETGEVRDIFEENVDTQYESGQGTINWKYLSASDEIIWYSERSDWGHLYLYDANTGTVKNQITSGEYVVREVRHVDEKKREIYFIAGGKEEGVNPYYRYLYRVNFNGKNLTLLTPDEGDHSISFSPDYNYFIDAYSQPTVPPVYEVRNKKGKQIATLEETDISRLEAAGWKPPTPFTVRSADDRWDLYGMLYTPTNLDSTKKYPVIVYIYPGPQGGSVGSWKFYAARRDNQALAELGFVVMALEGSCNPNRSKSFHDACYGDMSENTLPDQISGLRQLAERYAFLDLDRVGIWGHSGGGFATAAAMFKYPDFFKVGISESGNHDNRNYEDDWGERYIGLETYNDAGISNYGQQANQQLAKDLEGKLLLIHGGLDDNVPPYNTYLVLDALIKANKDFDFLLLPNARHGYGLDSHYIMRRRWDYFIEHLMKGTPPKEYLIDIEEDPRLEESE